MTSGAAGYYACLPYSVAQLLIEVPYLLALATMFVAIIYSMIGTHHSAAHVFAPVVMRQAVHV